MNSLIANNTTVGTGTNVSGNFTSQGYNLLGSTNGGSGFGGSGDIINTNPLLGPLADNGGSTLTLALLPGSPALDTGTSLGTPSTDQRGIARPQGSVVDIGAFESVASLQLTGMAISNGVFRFVLNGPVGSNYVIQVSSNLVTWLAILTNQIPPAGLTNLIILNTASKPRQFYRAVPFGLIAGRIVAWGSNSNGQTNAPAGTNWIAVAGGYYHSLALMTDGTVVGWGDNGLNQTNTPPGLTNVVAITAGWGTSFALKKDGTVLNWGWNPASGLLAFATNLTSIASISADWDCCMALKSNSTVVVWGVSTHGETNVPSGLNSVVSVAGGGFHCLALRSDGTVVVWGNNANNQTNVPSGLTNVTAIAGGGYHCVALRSDGTVVAWGKNDLGQATVPAGLTNVTAISAGTYHSLALKADGTVVVWGDVSQTNAPASLTNTFSISAGGYHSLVITK